MKKINLFKTVLAGGLLIASLAATATAQTIVNDRFWKDTDGNFIYSQGGGVLQVGDTFYWYGVKYNGAVTYAANPTKKNDDTGFAGVTCYSSKDLVNWKFEGIVLKPSEAGGGWFGRIGVVYNAKSKKYVLAGQGASPSWEYGEYFATSDSPTGPFKFARVQPESEMTFFVNNNTGDQTLFQDDDGKAYVIASNVKGRTNLYVAPLRESDFLAIDGSRTVNIHKSRVGGREGNAMFKQNGVYYFCSSDLHGWNTSQTYCMSATNILGPYSEEFVLEGTQHDFSHVTQTGFFVMVKGSKGSFVVNAGDRWSDFAGNGLGYNQWLPISFETGKPVFHSLSEWNIDVKEGTWSVGAGNNYCLNPTFEADRVSQTTLTGWKLDKADANNINSTSKKRTGRWGLYLTDSKSLTQTLTVPNGKYTLSAYVQSSGGQSSAKMFAKDFGSSEQNVSIAAAAGNWTKKAVENIIVTNGKITIGFSTAGSSSQWIAVDDIELIKSGKNYKVSLNAGIGGTIAQNIAGTEIPEGSNVTFTATPLDGWEFAGWNGDASGLDKEYVVASLGKDVNLGATFKFVGKDSLKYEAENTVFNQTLFEDKHEGFSGKGYANLDNAVGSSITFALCLPEGDERKVKLTFANGGSANRPVSISVNGKVLVERLDLEPTGGWTTWNDAELTLKIPAGVNTLEIASLTEDGAPNIDKIEFVRADSGTTVLHKVAPAEVSKARTGKRFYVNGRAVNALRAGNRKAVQPTFTK
ncbi:MAG: family 43 glycosylhydrolase [Fibrobacter sp.]|uniref:family 43 glycosylhydrolase n=1 Tax=Fibrobacter sp. TaxID=35828 RepID=UPI0025BC881B|nr:family 43 glycosylhydrolase [Fibrobacter sp.]MBS7272046.1 family 43 glycosylhydrolase [Fibrobacter sp.]